MTVRAAAGGHGPLRHSARLPKGSRPRWAPRSGPRQAAAWPAWLPGASFPAHPRDATGTTGRRDRPWLGRVRWCPAGPLPRRPRQPLRPEGRRETPSPPGFLRFLHRSAWELPTPAGRSGPQQPDLLEPQFRGARLAKVQAPPDAVGQAASKEPPFGECPFLRAWLSLVLRPATLQEPLAAPETVPAGAPSGSKLWKAPPRSTSGEGWRPARIFSVVATGATGSTARWSVRRKGRTPPTKASHRPGRPTKAIRAARGRQMPRS